MKKIFENKIFLIAGLIVLFGLATVFAETIIIGSDGIVSSNGHSGATMNMTVTDDNGDKWFMVYEDGLLVNQTRLITELSNGLVAYYDLDESSGTLAYDSLNLLNMTEIGTSSLPGYTGKLGNSWNFSYDSHNLATYSTSGISGSSPRTISGWIYFEDDNSNSVMAGIGYSGASQEFAIGRNADNNVHFTGWMNDFSGNAILNASNWYHLAATYDGATVSIYVDGELDSTAVKALSTTDWYIKIGTRQGWTIGHNGLIDEVGIWERELTADEVSELYNSGSGLAYSDF
jgi:hypothetical protein